MNYEEFLKNIVDNIKDYLTDKYKDALVEIQHVAKMNDQNLDGLTILADDSNIAPNIYLKSFFEDYLNGKSMSDILTAIADIRLANEQEQFDVAEITSWENVKDKIMPVICNEEDNTQRLSDMPYTKVEDLAVSYQVVIEMNSGDTGAVPITNSLMEKYGVTVEELHQVSLDNINQENGIYFKDMRDTMKEIMLADMPPEMTREEAEAMLDSMMSQEDTTAMYVLSNEARVKGASAILNDDVRQMVAEQVGGDYFVLPSSIHECLIVPKDSGMTYEELQDMVQDINATQVAPEERLSDYVYEYDAEKHDLQRCDWKEEREMNREKLAKDEKFSDLRSDKAERPSLKEKLEAKKMEAAKAGVEKFPGKEQKKETTIA